MYLITSFLLLLFSWGLYGQDRVDNIGELSSSNDKEYCYIRMNQDERVEGLLDPSSSSDEEDNNREDSSQIR